MGTKHSKQKRPSKRVVPAKIYEEDKNKLVDIRNKNGLHSIADAVHTIIPTDATTRKK